MFSSAQSYNERKQLKNLINGWVMAINEDTAALDLVERGSWSLCECYPRGMIEKKENWAENFQATMFIFSMPVNHIEL